MYAAMIAARDCAVIMLETAEYIQAELPDIQIGEALRLQAETVCIALIGTKHDVISALFELDNLLRQRGASSSEIASRLNRVIRWLQEGVLGMHEFVMALDSAKQRNPAVVPAYVLVAESAANILNAYNRMTEAVDRLGIGKN